MPTFDRFDIVEAWYVWLCLHHDGKGYPRQDPRYWSSYGRMSTMESRLSFKPRSDLDIETLTENAREIYDNICRRAGWCDCLREVEKCSVCGTEKKQGSPCPGHGN